MLVGDIYGMDYGKIGLKSTAIASTFGKVFRLQSEAQHKENEGGTENGTEPADDDLMFKHEDMSRSLLYAIR